MSKEGSVCEDLNVKNLETIIDSDNHAFVDVWILDRNMHLILGYNESSKTLVPFRGIPRNKETVLYTVIRAVFGGTCRSITLTRKDIIEKCIILLVTLKEVGYTFVVYLNDLDVDVCRAHMKTELIAENARRIRGTSDLVSVSFMEPLENNDKVLDINRNSYKINPRAIQKFAHIRKNPIFGLIK
jgi:hypothetical protein